VGILPRDVHYTFFGEGKELGLDPVEYAGDHLTRECGARPDVHHPIVELHIVVLVQLLAVGLVESKRHAYRFFYNEVTRCLQDDTVVGKTGDVLHRLAVIGYGEFG